MGLVDHMGDVDIADNTGTAAEQCTVTAGSQAVHGGDR